MIKITSNKSERTYRIHTYYPNGDACAIYKTSKLSKQEFEDMEYYTEKDWRNYLKKGNDYQLIKNYSGI